MQAVILTALAASLTLGPADPGTPKPQDVPWDQKDAKDVPAPESDEGPADDKPSWDDEDKPEDAAADETEPEGPEEPEQPDLSKKPDFGKIVAPPAPHRKGTGLYIATGVVAAGALALQIAAYQREVKECVDDFDDSGLDPDEIVEDSLTCAESLAVSLALRVVSGVMYATASGLAAGAGVRRARYDSWYDTYRTGGLGRRRNFRGLMIVGIFLSAGGGVYWAATRLTSISRALNCDTLGCLKKSRTFSFTSRNIGLIMMGSGFGLLGYAITYATIHPTNLHYRKWVVAPQVSRRHFGLGLTGRF